MPRSLARLLCANVVALMGVVAVWVATSDIPHGWLMAAPAVAPLAATLPGLRRGSRYTAAWASLLAVPYLMFGVVESVANPPARVIAAVELGTAFILFAGLLAGARGLRRPP